MVALISIQPVFLHWRRFGVPSARIIHKNCLHCYVYGLDMLQTAHLGVGGSRYWKTNLYFTTRWPSFPTRARRGPFLYNIAQKRGSLGLICCTNDETDEQQAINAPTTYPSRRECPATPQDKRERRVNISMTRLYLRPIKMSHYQCIIFIEAWLSHQSTRAGRLTGPGPGGLAAQFLSLRTCQMECHRKGAPVCDTRHGKAARRPGKSVSPFPIFAAKALAGRASRVAKGFTGGINEKLYKHIKVRPIKSVHHQHTSSHPPVD